jgi:hypothetical protein
MGFFPVDDETLRFLHRTGRTEAEVELVEKYYKAQGMFRTASSPEPRFSSKLELELSKVNQIEKHTEKPAILMVSRSFESRYHLATMVDRNLWVREDFAEPSYAGPSWVLWTASQRLRIDGVAGPVRWVVVRR